MDNTFWQTQRMIADPLADELVDELMTSGEYLNSRDLMGKLMKNNDLVSFKASNSIPIPIHKFLIETSNLPIWLDINKIKIAQRVGTNYNIEGAFVLLFKSLPMCYCMAKGAKVLHTTGRLLADKESFDINKDSTTTFLHRVMMSLQFVEDVAQFDGFNESGSAIVTTQKVRLVHSSIRNFIKEKIPNWNNEELGVPINQEDLLFTLTTFSVGMIQGLSIMGIKLTDEEKESYMHLWRVIGYILGISEELLPKNYQEGINFQSGIIDREATYSKEGNDLMTSVVNLIEFILPGNVSNIFVVNLVHHFIGDKICNCVGIEPTSNTVKFRVKLIRKFFIIIAKLEENNTFIGKFVRYIVNKVVKYVINKLNGNKEIMFRPPIDLVG